MRSLIIVSLVLIFITSFVVPAPASAWRSRTIYQVLTDRFARTDGSTSQCGNLGNYCGGTFQGIINHLDYITGMGFDAIWISPVVINTPGGYHGYWAKDITGINPNFGTATDLKNLVNACHQKGVWVMVDVVANHMGNVGFDYFGLVPFNQASHFHNCASCPPGCNIQDWNNQQQVEICRLAGLPDLNQTNSYVGSTLLSWIHNLINTYGFDGMRVDTVPEVAKSFWTQFQSSAGVFGIGEVFNGDVGYVASYQGPLNALLSYPMYFTLRSVFQSKQSMYQIQNEVTSYKAFSDTSILGTFIDNHDNPRFLNGQQDIQLYKSALTYVLMSQGIPIIYYGTEQGFSGGDDPYCREALWPTNYNTNSQLYGFIQTLVNFRKSANIASQPQVQRYADDNFYAFTRGTVFVATTNVGSGQPQVVRTITYHPYADGTKLCNLFYTTDCIVVQGGKFNVYLVNGESKVFHPV